MLIYEVGEEFPIVHPIGSRSGFMVQTMEGGSFDILAYIDRPTAKEKREFKQGIFRVGCYVDSDIPFIVCQFDTIESDAPFNAHKINSELVGNWLNTEANAVTFYLIDAKTNILQAMRLIGIDFMNDLKNTLRKQLTTYNSSKAVDYKIDEIYNRVTTIQMLQNSKLQAFVK